MALWVAAGISIICLALLYTLKSGMHFDAPKPVSRERLEAFMSHSRANEPVHILVYRKYNFAWPQCWTTSPDDEDKAFDMTASQLLETLGGALVARTKAFMPTWLGLDEAGWYVSMYGLPNRSSYVELINSSKYKEAQDKLSSCFSTQMESIAIANWVDNRLNPETDCSWKPWGFDPSAAFPWPTSLGQKLFNSVLAQEDDGFPIHVWNVDQYKAGRAHDMGGSKEYRKGATKAIWKMGSMSSIRAMCPENVCDTQPLEGDFLRGINSVNIVEYPSMRALLRMMSDEDFDGSLKKSGEANPFVKNADVPARNIRDEVRVITPSPFSKARPPLATDCEDASYKRARIGELAKAADGSTCDVVAMEKDYDRCTRAVLNGKCHDSEGRSCADWLLGPGIVCTQAIRYTLMETYPEKAGAYTGGLKSTAQLNGALDACSL